LFDHPYLDENQALSIVGRADFKAMGLEAQRKSLVLLKNGDVKDGKALPLEKGLKIFVKGFDKKVVGQYATVVDRPEDADFAIIRLDAPFQPRPGFVEGLFHHGDLDFKEPKKTEILDLLKKTPTIVSIYLDRPAVIPEIAEKSAALIANFGATDAAILDVVFGKAHPTGKLPIELPSSMDAVRKQKEDVPYDSEAPLFPFGFGLRY
jgi:beta-glucosidase